MVFAKGYGLADRDRAIPVTAQTLFRTGSINKVVTAVAVLKLVESNKLGLDDPVLPLLERVGVVLA